MYNNNTTDKKPNKIKCSINKDIRRTRSRLSFDWTPIYCAEMPLLRNISAPHYSFSLFYRKKGAIRLNRSIQFVEGKRAYRPAPQTKCVLSEIATNIRSYQTVATELFQHVVLCERIRITVFSTGDCQGCFVNSSISVLSEDKNSKSLENKT